MNARAKDKFTQELLAYQSAREWVDLLKDFTLMATINNLRALLADSACLADHDIEGLQQMMLLIGIFEDFAAEEPAC